MYQKIIDSIGIKYIIKVNVLLSVKTQQYEINYRMTLDEFYDFKKNSDKHKVEYVFG